MRIDTLRMTCACSHVFDAEIVVDAPIKVAVASMRVIRCPKCGASGRKIYFGGEKKSAAVRRKRKA